MAAQNLTNLFADEDRRNDLLELIARALKIKAQDAEVRSLKQDLNIEAKKLGIQPSELQKIIKFLANTELLYNEAAFLDNITQIVSFLDEAE